MKPQALPHPFEHGIERLAGQSLLSLADEEPRELAVSLLQVTSDGTEFVTRDGLLRGETPLHALHPDPGALQVDVLAS